MGKTEKSTSELYGWVTTEIQQPQELPNIRKVHLYSRREVAYEDAFKIRNNLKKAGWKEFSFGKKGFWVLYPPPAFADQPPITVKIMPVETFLRQDNVQDPRLLSHLEQPGIKKRAAILAAASRARAEERRQIREVARVFDLSNESQAEKILAALDGGEET